MNKFQFELTVSSTEIEYDILSQAMQNIIPAMSFLEEVSKVFCFIPKTPEVCCTVFEDNLNCKAVAVSPCMTTQTKHIALKYHHFCQHV